MSIKCDWWVLNISLEISQFKIICVRKLRIFYDSVEGKKVKLLFQWNTKGIK